MGILSSLKNAAERVGSKVTGKSNKEEYTPEQAKGLETAKAMALKRSAYFKEKAQFEKQQKREAYEQTIPYKYKQSTQKLKRYIPKATTSYKPISYVRRSNRSYYGGRPRGVYKHSIPGVGPVHVYTWRKWARAQKRAAALRGQQAIQQAQQYGQQPQYQQPRIADFEAQQQQNYPQPNQVVQNQPYVQPQPSFDGNFLKIKPVFGMIGLNPENSSNNSNSLTNRPINPFKQASMFNIQLPITNPNGDYYTEPDFFSGRQVIKKRFRDRSFQT